MDSIRGRGAFLADLLRKCWDKGRVGPERRRRHGRPVKVLMFHPFALVNKPTSLASLHCLCYLPASSCLSLLHLRRQDAQTSYDAQWGELRADPRLDRAVNTNTSDQRIPVRLAIPVRVIPNPLFFRCVAPFTPLTRLTLARDVRPRLTRRSLPSLSHPFHSRGTSPPTTPGGGTHLDPSNVPPSYPSHPQSTYHALQGGLSAPLRLGGQTGPGGYSGRVLDEKLHLTLGGKGKEKDRAPRIFGIELKWIS